MDPQMQEGLYLDFNRLWNHKCRSYSRKLNSISIRFYHRLDLLTDQTTIQTSKETNETNKTSYTRAANPEISSIKLYLKTSRTKISHSTRKTTTQTSIKLQSSSSLSPVPQISQNHLNFLPPLPLPSLLNPSNSPCSGSTELRGRDLQQRTVRSCYS
jgi:hypothetical protein